MRRDVVRRGLPTPAKRWHLFCLLGETLLPTLCNDRSMAIHIYSHYERGQTGLSNLPRLSALDMPPTASHPLVHDLYDVGERSRLGSFNVSSISRRIPGQTYASRKRERVLPVAMCPTSLWALLMTLSR